MPCSRRAVCYSVVLRTQLQRLVLGAHHPVEPDQDGVSLNVLAHLQHSDEGVSVRTGEPLSLSRLLITEIRDIPKKLFSLPYVSPYPPYPTSVHSSLGNIMCMHWKEQKNWLNCCVIYRSMEVHSRSGGSFTYMVHSVYRKSFLRWDVVTIVLARGEDVHCLHIFST